MIALYSAMVKYRGLADAGRLTSGREAMVAAATADLKPGDTFAATQSELLSLFVKSPRARNSSRSENRNGHQPLSSSDKFVAAAQAAAAHREASKGGVALFLCDNRVKAALWRSQLQRVSRANLPLIVVRLLDAPAGKASSNRQPPEALEFGAPRIDVDADDVRAIYRVVSESLGRARLGRGPTVIDCLNFRNSDPALADPDPIGSFEAVLTRKRILNAALKRKIENNAGRELNKAFRSLPG
jgi:hypothetical protein